MNYSLSSFDGVLVSHEHKDHCKGLPDALKKALDCYTTKDVVKSLKLSGHRLHEIKAGNLFKVGSFNILPFDLQHDAPNVGFLIQSGNEKMIYITDSYYCKYKFNGLTMIAIECNYKKSLLEENIEAGTVPAEMRYRTERSHFELENVKNFLKENCLKKVREIHLIHISSKNGDPELFQSEIEGLTGIATYTH